MIAASWNLALSSHAVQAEQRMPTQAEFSAFLQARTPTTSGELRRRSCEDVGLPAIQSPDGKVQRSVRPTDSVFRPTKYGHIFTQHSVFFALNSCLPLYRILMPSGGWLGLVAFDGTDLIELTPESSSGLSRVLRREGDRLFRSDPRPLAGFFIDVLSWEEFGFQPSLIESANQIMGSEHCRPPFDRTSCQPGGFVVDQQELAKYQSSLGPPEISGNPERGWVIEYVTIEVGTAAHRGILEKWHVKVRSDYRAEVRSETLSTHVFHAVPQYRI
ncbi:MAG: hypothetical protein U0900_21095 [Myxococcota bacterium]